MKARQFVRAIKAAVCEGAANGTVSALTEVPGRRPDPNLVASSSWFKQLKQEDRDEVVRLIEMASVQATYNFLLVLDGLISLEPPGPKGRLELFFSDGKVRNHLNNIMGEQLSSLFKGS
jgi:hypothetical protein